MGLGGGCAVPVAAFARVHGDQLSLHGRVTAPDGSRQIDVSGSGPAAEAAAVGQRLAREAWTLGAGAILDAAVENES